MPAFGNPFTFTGRISRRTLWVRYALGCALVTAAAAAVDGAVLGRPLLAPTAGLVLLVVSLGGQVRRLHDRDRSGWWVLASLTGIGAIWLFIELGFLRGTVGSNRFGPDPVAGFGSGAVPAAA